MPRTPEERAAKKAEIAEIKKEKDNFEKSLEKIVKELEPYKNITLNDILNYIDARFKVIEDELGIINMLKAEK